MKKRRRVQDLVGQADIDLIDLFLKDYFKSGHKVIDVGCGEGRNLELFVNSEVDYYGLDESESAVRMAKMLLRSKDARFNEEQIQKANLLEHPFPQRAFDWVFAINVLQHCRSKRHFAEMVAAISHLGTESGSVLIKSTTKNRHETISFVIDEEAVNSLKTCLPNHSCALTKKITLMKEEIVVLLVPRAQDP